MYLLSHAVSCRQHVLLVDERPPTELPVSVHQSRLVNCPISQDPRLGWLTHHERILVLDGLIPVDDVRECSKKALCGTWLVVQGDFWPDTTEAAVFGEQELDRELVFHKVLRFRLGKILRPLESRGQRLIAANSEGLEIFLMRVILGKSAAARKKSSSDR